MTQLTLQLDGTDYRVVSLCGGGWRLLRFDCRGAYDLAVVDGRVTCSCGDYRHRQAITPDGRCKHGQALVTTGLIVPAPAVEVARVEVAGNPE